MLQPISCSTVGKWGEWWDLHKRDSHESIILVQDSQDVEAVVETIGRDFDASEYGCYFVEMGDAEYKRIWGCTSYIPWNSSYIELVYSIVKPRTVQP